MKNFKKVLCAGLAMLITITTVNAADIENITPTSRNGFAVSGSNMGTRAAIKVLDSDGDIVYMAQNTNEGNFLQNCYIEGAEGFYDVFVQDGNLNNSAKRSQVYLGDISASAIELNITSAEIKAGERVEAKSNLYNSASAETVYMFCAIYDNDNRLTNLLSATKTISTGASDTIEMIFSFPVVKDAAEVKFMLMTDEFKPLAMPVNKRAAVTEYIYVDSLADAENADGTEEAPFKTIEDGIAAANDNAAILVKGGEYKSFGINLSAADSNLSISAYNGDVYVNSSEKLTGFEPVTEENKPSGLPSESIGKVYRLNLAEAGIEAPKIPQIQYGAEEIPFPVITVNNEKFNVARWPNEGFTNVGNVISGEVDTRIENPKAASMTFYYDNDRISKWVNAENAYLTGYWKNGWAIDSVKIDNINVMTKVITTKGSGTWGITNTLPGGRFYVSNLIEELDSHNEWYADNEYLYIYYDGDIETADIEFAGEQMQALITVTDAQNITFNGLTIENVMGNGIKIDNSKNISIGNCTFRNIALDAVVTSKVESCNVTDCEIYSIGAGGVTLSGGAVASLSHANNYVENTSIHDYAEDYRVYNSAIYLSGVGNKAHHNEIYNSSHMAIGLNGNENIIENNYIHDVLKESADAGAVYCGRSYLRNGNVIRYNYFKNLKRVGTNNYVSAVFLDDFASGFEVYANVMDNVDAGFVIGGGRNNVFYDNIIMNSPANAKNAFYAESRMTARWIANCDTYVQEFVNAYPKLGKVWNKRYPIVTEMYEEAQLTPADGTASLQLPKNNTIKRNVIYNHKDALIDSEISDNGIIENNLKLSGTAVDYVNGDTTLRDKIFSQIPDFKYTFFEQVGILK